MFCFALSLATSSANIVDFRVLLEGTMVPLRTAGGYAVRLPTVCNLITATSVTRSQINPAAISRWRPARRIRFHSTASCARRISPRLASVLPSADRVGISTEDVFGYHEQCRSERHPPVGFTFRDSRAAHLVVVLWVRKPCAFQHAMARTLGGEIVPDWGCQFCDDPGGNQVLSFIYFAKRVVHLSRALLDPRRRSQLS